MQKLYMQTKITHTKITYTWKENKNANYACSAWSTTIFHWPPTC